MPPVILNALPYVIKFGALGFAVAIETFFPADEITAERMRVMAAALA